MRPTPIPDAEVWPGHRRMVVGPPAGADWTEDVRAIEAQVIREAGGMPVFAMRLVPEPGDVARLIAGDPAWLSNWSAIVPFDVAFTERPAPCPPVYVVQVAELAGTWRTISVHLDLLEAQGQVTEATAWRYVPEGLWIGSDAGGFELYRVELAKFVPGNAATFTEPPGRLEGRHDTLGAA